MRPGKNSARVRWISIRKASLFIALGICLLPVVAHAQQAAAPKRILILYWYNREYAGNIAFEQSFRTGLQSAPAGTVEYYSEYLESNRFPGENQELLMRNFLREKYADRNIDVIIAVTDKPLEFLLKYRRELFTNTPIVFAAVKAPTSTELAIGPGMTGIVYGGNQRSTLELALKLHPDTEQVFIVSGTLDHDKRFELACRKDLEGYESKVSITYLTDLPLGELIANVRSLPERSIVLYLWQQSYDEKGSVLESPDVLALISLSTRVPIYGLTAPMLGSGIVGGNLRVPERIATSAAEIAMKIAAGTRAQDIPVQTPPTVPMFDWSKLRRWRISEDQLPPGSIVRFRERSFWDEYKWYAIALVSVVVLQSVLIAGLIINRSRRKRVEEHLRESETGRLLAQQAARIGTFEWNIQTGVNVWSRDLEAMHGLSPGSFGGSQTDWENLVHPDDRSRAVASVEQAVETGAPVEDEWRVRWPDGSTHWVFGRFQVYPDSSGAPLKLTGINIDVTERKLADESLHQSEERNRALLRAVPDLMFLHTVDGVYLDYQANDLNDLLVPPSEFLGKNIRDVMPAELAEPFLSSFRRAQETGEPQSVEYMLPLNGEERWFEARLVTTQGDKILSVVRDVTSRKLAEAALVKSEAQMGGIIGSAMDGIISIDEHQRIVLFNAAAELMFGYSASDVIGHSLDCLIPEQFRQAHHTHVRAFGDTNVSTRAMGSLGAIYGCRANGELFPIEAFISQLDLQGQKFYTVILRDITERRQAMDALREVQESLTIALEASQMGTWDLDLTKDFSGHRSLRHDQIFGYDRQQVDWGREVARRHIVEEDRSIFDTAFARAMASGDLDFEVRVRWQDGSVHWMAARGRFYFDENGQPTRGAGVNFDITARKRAEGAMSESEERFRVMADTAPVLIWMSGPDKLRTYFNRQWLEFTGRTMEQELGNGWAEGVHPEDYAHCLATYGSAFDTRGSFGMEYRLRHHDGEYLWVLDTGVPRMTPDGTFAGFIGSVIDITERKQFEQMLRKIAEGVSASTSEDFLRSLARHLSEVLEIDFVFVGLLAGDNHDRVKTVVALMDGEIVENFEYDIENTPCESVMKLGVISCASGVQSRFPRDRQLVEMGVESYLGMALRDAAGQAFGLVSVMDRAVMKNIETHESLLQIFTSRAAAEMERTQAHQALQQTQSELAHVARVMITGELAATIAHEVNQPLTAMVANANATRRMLGNGNTDLVEAREAIEDIVRDAHRASEVVGRIRMLLRKEPHRTELLAINEVIEEVVAITRNDLIGKRVTLRMELAEDLPKVEADRVEIQQVMLNLMMNAIEAMRAVEAGRRNLLMRTTRNESGGVLVEVQDSGVGIASEALERIFDAFYTTRKEGMGMGLSICRTIIESHGGRLKAESNKGKGATFRFTLSAANGDLDK